MNADEKRERVRLNLQRRARRLIESHAMPSMSRRRMHVMTSRLSHVVGDDGLTDVDLWTVIRLTLRGLFD